MAEHETQYCPRCGKTFVCKRGDITHCQCSCIPLSNATRDFLAKTSYGCLCKDCLQEINRFVHKAQAYRFPTRKEMLVEGLHYYQEAGNWVFTGLYHYLRGACCGNGCRHCVYGNGKH